MQASHRFAAAMIAAALLVQMPSAAQAESAQQIEEKARVALEALFDSTPGARALAKQAKAVLVFPQILKAGFLVGAQGGDGVLLKGGRAVAFYRSLAASYGFQAGVESFSYVLMFLDEESLVYLDKSDGWELGVGPTLVVVDQGMQKNLSTTTLQKGVYAFIYGQQGLMAGIGIQGSKITRINPE